jgi:hypothetical protein
VYALSSNPSTTLKKKYPTQKKIVGVTQELECLPSKHEALSSNPNNPNTTKKKKRKKERKKERKEERKRERERKKTEGFIWVYVFVRPEPQKYSGSHKPSESRAIWIGRR